MTNLNLTKSQIAPMKKVLFWMSCAACIIFGNTIQAQKNFTTHGLMNTPQSHYYNPAFRTSAKVFVTVLPMQSIGLSNSGFNANHLLTRRADDSLEFNIANAIDRMAKLNFLVADAQNEILGIALNLNDQYFSFSVMHRGYASFAYPKDLIRLVFEGNGGELLGKRASLDGLGVNGASYMEYNFGYNREMFGKWNLGARAKFISGIANVNTRKSQLGIFTDENTFDITIDGAYHLNTSNIFTDEGENDLAAGDYIRSAYNFKNAGFGADLGATYEHSSNLKLNASVLDLGFVRWKTNTMNYKQDEIEYTFRGLEAKNFNSFDPDQEFQEIMDSIEKQLTLDPNRDSYFTRLPTRILIGANYQLTKQIGVGGMWFNEFTNKRYRPALVLSGNIQLKNWLSFTANYSMYARSFGNIGAGVSLRLGPIQWFMVSDNLLGYLDPMGSKNFHFATGMSVLIGKERERSESKYQ